MGALSMNASIFVVLAITLASTSARTDDRARTDMREASQYAARKLALSGALLRLESTEQTIASRLDLATNKLRLGQRWRVEITQPRVLIALKEAPSAEHGMVTRVFEYVVETKTGAYDLVRVTDVESKSNVLLRFSARRELESSIGEALGGLSDFGLSVPRFNDQEFTESAGGVEYTGEDSFSRPVRVVWNKDEPWPALMNGTMGTAKLVSVDESAR